jgi:hypothetical protein
MWKKYFDDLSFGLNYHTIRCLISELIPSLLVALFNIGIITCIVCTSAHVRRRQQFHPTNQLSSSIGTGSITKFPALLPSNLNDKSQQLQRQCSFKGSLHSTTSVPFGKMSWMNIVLLLHSLLFFLSSSVSSLVFFSTSDIVLAHWVSVIILATCSLNFYVYCLSGRQFRRELKRIAEHYMRHIQKIFIRNFYTSDRRRSPVQIVKKNAYQMKPRNSPGSPCIKPYPIRQVMEQIE